MQEKHYTYLQIDNLFSISVSPQQTIHTLSFYLFILYFIIISTFVSNCVVQTIIYDNQTQVYVLYWMKLPFSYMNDFTELYN